MSKTVFTNGVPSSTIGIHASFALDHLLGMLGSRVVTPAFINAHTHLPMVAMRGIEGCAKAMTGSSCETPAWDRPPGTAQMKLII
eukprot:5403241-Amphidinium_carterae.1